MELAPPERFFAELRRAGMSEVPDAFSVACFAQEIPRAVVAEIEAFVTTFDRVTGRPAWQDAMTADVPEIARQRRREACFFSAWDFHLPPESPHAWQLIEFNDNGSGVVLAGLINRVFYDVCGLERRSDLEPPLPRQEFSDRLAAMIAGEAEAFLGGPSQRQLLILDDAESLDRGRFRREIELLKELLCAAGWRAEIGPPEALRWDGRRLLCGALEVSFVINRSTDFFWQGSAFSPLRAAYQDNRVYVAPNPFTYATRSDKRLLEPLSHADWDAKLGIAAEERALLSGHVPETFLLREDNLERLAAAKGELVFKPAHGFASRGLLPAAHVGRSRLRRLLAAGVPYVAQRHVPKSRISVQGQSLWTDLRVWSHRGQRYLLSGRASRDPDRLDLSPPAGWVPTYVGA